MSRWRALWLFLALVPVFNGLTVLVLPTVINHLVMHRIAAQGVAQATVAHPTPRQSDVLVRQGLNVALPAPRATADARTVVRPSPDLLYTACVFDLADGPLHLRAPVPPGYLSLSAFSADSSNFFAMNDGDATVNADGQRELHVVLSRHANIPVPEGAKLVVSPSTRGLVLFRLLVREDERASLLREQFQWQQRCEPIT